MAEALRVVGGSRPGSPSEERAQGRKESQTGGAVLAARGVSVAARGALLLRDVHLEVAARGVIGRHRAVGGRQEHSAQGVQPPARARDAAARAQRRGALSRPVDPRRRRRSRCAAQPHRHALPAADRLPDQRCPQRALRSAPRRAPVASRPGRAAGGGAHRRRAVGRGQGPPAGAGGRALGRAAAAALPGAEPWRCAPR